MAELTQQEWDFLPKINQCNIFHHTTVILFFKTIYMTAVQQGDTSVYMVCLYLIFASVFSGHHAPGCQSTEAMACHIPFLTFLQPDI